MQYLSIDVALGSVGSSVLAAKVVGAKLPWSYWLMLPLCVWIIYTTDHLLDALKLKDRASMGRHRFHYLHIKSIGIFLGLAVLISIVLMLTLNIHTLVFGMFVYTFLMLYFSITHFRNRFFRVFPRELVVAFGYMVGTWGVPMLSRYLSISKMDYLLLLDHFLIIFSIPLLYAICEYEADIAGGFVSFATAFGIEATSIVVSVSLTIAALLSIFSFIAMEGFVSIVLMLMTLIMAVVFTFRKKLAVENLRTISDSVPFLPFLLLV